VLWTTPVSVFVTFTVAPGSTAPVRSVTVPSTVARTACAAALPPRANESAVIHRMARLRVTMAGLLVKSYVDRLGLRARATLR
jgi:hypothetical protein